MAFTLSTLLRYVLLTQESFKPAPCASRSASVSRSLCTYLKINPINLAPELFFASERVGWLAMLCLPLSLARQLTIALNVSFIPPQCHPPGSAM